MALRSICPPIDLYRGYAAIVAGEPFPASEFEPLLLGDLRRANAAYVTPEEEVLAKYQDQFRVKKDMPVLQNFRRLSLYAYNT